MEQYPNWEKVSDNYVLACGDYYISYNPDTRRLVGGLTDLANSLSRIGKLGIDFKDGEETALKKRDGGWLILEGDYRREYEDASKKGYLACLDFYYSKEPKNGSTWSSE